jgi:hypothetical protein
MVAPLAQGGERLRAIERLALAAAPVGLSSDSVASTPRSPAVTVAVVAAGRVGARGQGAQLAPERLQDPPSALRSASRSSAAFQALHAQYGDPVSAYHARLRQAV